MNNKTFTKAYLVEFTDKRDGYSFLKFGATNDYDVTKRFEYEPEQYKNYDIRVIGSIYANQNNVNYKRMGEVEEYFLSKYPRNTKYFKNNFSGISETYQPANERERKKMISEFYDVRTKILEGVDIKDVEDSNKEIIIDEKTMNIVRAVNEIEQNVRYHLFKFNNSTKRGWKEGKPQAIMDKEYRYTVQKVFDKLFENNEFTDEQRKELNLFQAILKKESSHDAFNGRPYDFARKVENIRENFIKNLGFRFREYQFRNKLYITRSKEELENHYGRQNYGWEEELERPSRY